MGLSNDKFDAGSSTKWLSVVGIGEDGVRGLGEEAREAVKRAAYVFGGKRHLALAHELIIGESLPWLHPFDTSMACVLEKRGEKTCILASGDPSFYGVGATLSRFMNAAEMRVFPAPSAFSLAAARLGWPLQETQCLSLHAHPIANLRRYLQPGQHVLALTSGAQSPAEIAHYLCAHGFGASHITVLEALGGTREKISEHIASGFNAPAIDPLNLIAIKVVASDDARIIPSSPGLPDNWFDHDGQITKRDIRAWTIAALAPQPGERLWDIGAGAGSVSIEWMLSAPDMRAIAIESNQARAENIKANALALGTPELKLVEGRAPEALNGLDTPDAIFIGGGGTNDGVVQAAIDALPIGGRLVANAVTVEMEAVLMDAHAKLGGDMTRCAVSKIEPIGKLKTWRPALPITQWSWRKS